jgi:hypothetical protein
MANSKKLKVGGVIWIQCDVKPGPFSDERLVRIRSDFGEWVGFVAVESLRDSITEGETYIRGIIIDVRDDRFEVNLPGHPVTPSIFQGSVARVQPLGSVEAGHSSLYQ